MALSRKLLSAMGIEADQVDQIIEAHAETVNGLKEQIEQYKADAEKLPEAQKELSNAKAELESLKADGGDWQKKFEKEHSDFEAYKTDIEAKETLATKREAYSNLLKTTGVSEKSISKILKLTDFNEIELEEGQIKDLETVEQNIKNDWGEFITQSDTSGADTKTPPANDRQSFTSEEIAKMTPDEINANWDAIKESMKGQ